MFAFTPSTPLTLPGTHRGALTPLRGVLARTAARHAPAVMVLSAKETQESAAVRITGNNIPLTDALRSYVNEKLGKVMRRFGGVIAKMDVHLTVEHNPSVPLRHKAEVVAFAGRTILRKEVRTDDMYASIDALEERIARTIRKYKERKDAKSKGKEYSSRTADDAQEVDEGEADDQFQDVYQDTMPQVPAVNAVVRRKVFPMPLQTVEEAVLCCEYVDHPWYLFRNAETKEIALVYKRNHGGYGLIEPSNPQVVDEEPV